jgi:hypothetical protein
MRPPKSRIFTLTPLLAALTLGPACTAEIDGTGDPAGTNPPAQGGVGGGTGGSSATSGAAGAPIAGSQNQAGGAQGGAAQAGAGQGGDPNAIPPTPPTPTIVATPRLARLSRAQWANTIRDLLKLADISEVERDVSGDARFGFDNQAVALFVTEQLRRQLADAAEKLADRVTGDDATLAALVPGDAPTDIAGRARSFVMSFGPRAFRRPLTAAEVTDHLALFDQGPTLYPGVDPFKAGVSLVIQAFLQSPHFLYRTELGTADVGATTVPLDDYEVGAKLAFAITNTMPDDEMFAAAAAGQLTDPAALSAQARRLIDGPRGRAARRLETAARR